MLEQFESFSQEAGTIALRIARRSLEQFVLEQTLFTPVLEVLPPALQKEGACFITLTNNGELRGCMGHTDAMYPLAEDIARNATAASRDFRFPSVQQDELEDIRIEVTILTPLVQVIFENLTNLIQQVRPTIDGVMLTKGGKRGLLLPQVWNRIPDPLAFLHAIMQKAGIPEEELLANPPFIICHKFQVQHFSELGYREPGK